MHRKIEINNLNIPKDDIECWNRYPKYRWVYELSRLLDAQNIKWSLFETEGMNQHLSVDLETQEDLKYTPGYIYLCKVNSPQIITEVYILKGEIKLMRQIGKSHNNNIELNSGTIELVINAFVSMHFQKFTGVISVTTQGKEIHKIKLRPVIDLGQETNQDIVKLAKRIYRKIDININGLADRTHQEIHAS